MAIPFTLGNHRAQFVSATNAALERLSNSAWLGAELSRLSRICSARMRIRVLGILRFQHRAALEKGIVAFDEHAYSEFFQSELWTLSGPYAICERTFDIESDCDHARAFFAMAKHAVEGAIDLAESGAGAFVRVMRTPRPGKGWTRVTLDLKSAELGAKFADYSTQWGPLIQKAKVEETATKKKVGAKQTKTTKTGRHDPAKSATKPKVAGPSVAITLAAHPSGLIELSDRSLAVAAGSKVMFVLPTGELIGAVECALTKHDHFGEIHGLTSLADGRVVAFNKDASEVRLVRAGDGRATALVLPDKYAAAIQNVVSGGDRIYLATHESVVVVDLATGTVVKELRPATTDFVVAVLLHGDAVVVSTQGETAVFDRNYARRFVVKGSLVESTADGILVHRDDKAAVLMTMNGKRRCGFEAGSVTPGRDNTGRGPKGPWAVVGDAVYVASRWPRTVTKWSLANGKQVWRAAPTHNVFPGGCIATDSYVAYWAPPQFHSGEFDSGIAVLDPKTGKPLARLDAKVPLIDVVPFGHDAVAAVADGRTAGPKLHVWRNITTKPRAEILGAHESRIAGLRRLSDGRLVSWAANKLLRIWS
ncbi:MAG: hypothetical protein M3680_19740 [Myxococcota bacterium]|nr:hypothetical protein [Myxococcota bacterium]